MKILKKTRNYFTVRMTADELEILTNGIERDKQRKESDKRKKEYSDWFYRNHVRRSYQDEYSSWHEDWYNVTSGDPVRSPGYLSLEYAGLHQKAIEEAEKAWANRGRK